MNELLLVKGRVTLIRDHWPAWQVPLGLALMWFRVWVRYVAFWALKLTGRKGSAERFVLWQRVWQARRDWLAGY